MSSNKLLGEYEQSIISWNEKKKIYWENRVDALEFEENFKNNYKRYSWEQITKGL